MFNFQCCCTACENNFPLAQHISKTFSDIASNFVDKSEELDKFFETFLEGIKSNDFNQSFIGTHNRFKELLRLGTQNLETKNSESLKAILSLLDECNGIINDEIKICLDRQNIESCLKLYYEKQKMASMVLKPPHGIFISGRGAITECLSVKYGNVSYGTSRKKLYVNYI